MPVPKSVIKFNKDGFRIDSSVDKTKYLITELSRAALRDVGKFVVRETKSNFKQEGIQQHSKDGFKAIGYQVVKDDLKVTTGYLGGRVDGFYMKFFELGTSKRLAKSYSFKDKNGKVLSKIKGKFIRGTIPAKKCMTRAVDTNVSRIREIEMTYLNLVSDEQKAIAKINENTMEGDGGDTL